MRNVTVINNLWCPLQAPSDDFENVLASAGRIQSDINGLDGFIPKSRYANDRLKTLMKYARPIVGKKIAYQGAEAVYQTPLGESFPVPLEGQVMVRGLFIGFNRITDPGTAENLPEDVLLGFHLVDVDMRHRGGTHVTNHYDDVQQPIAKLQRVLYPQVD